MLNTLTLYLGSESSNFPIMQFCNAYPQLLEQKKIHHLTFSDLFPDKIHNTLNSMYYDDWLKENNQSFDEIIVQLKKQIQEKNIINLLLLLNFNEISHCFENLLKICKILNPERISIHHSSINPLQDFSARYNIWLLQIKNIHHSTLSYRFLQLYNSQFPLNTKLLQSVAKNCNTRILQKTYENEEDCFYDWLNQNQIEFPGECAFIPQSTFSPQVLAFLYTLSEIIVTAKPFLLADEHNFLYHFSKKNTFFCYHFKHLERELKLTDHYSEKNTCIDCSQIGLRPETHSAIELAKQLSSKTRRLLLENIAVTNIEEMSNNGKIIYLALMNAENKISLNEINSLLSSSKNSTVTITEQTENAPVLTIYTTSYNNKKYIAQCIESIAAQKTKYPFIHLISDDNSNDGTQELLREYAQKYPHIQLILRKQNNIGANYFGVLNSLATKYVAVCDADDFYTDEKKIEKQINFLEENPDCNICFHPAYVYYEKDNLIKNIHPNSVQNFVPKKFYYLSNIITTNLMQSSSVMFRWKWTKGITSETPLGLTPLDWALNITHAHNSKIGFINEPMSLYRRHEKAFYALTETNIPLHLITNCYSELQFIESLNLYTERKYEKLFLQKAFLILYNFYVTAKEIEYDKEKYNNIQKNIELYFPEYIKYFKDNLSKIK